MINKPSRALARQKKHKRMRGHIHGTAERPRLAVFRSNKHMYAQIIDDKKLRKALSTQTISKQQPALAK